MKKIHKIAGATMIGASLILAVGLLGISPDFVGQQQEDTPKSIQNVTESEMVQLKDGDTFDIVAKPVKQTINGQQVEMLSYNGSIPGPTIVVNEGDKIMLNIKNELGIPTTIHPHGINGSSDNDGVPDISQAPIEIGESYTQTIEFPEPGLFWYHPHIREDYTQASGMYANFIVKPQDTSSWPSVDKEHVMQLSDVSLTDDGLQEFSKEEVTNTLMGRFGNVQLVNGKTDQTFESAVGEVQRVYITNTSSVRSYRFEIPGIKLKLIGGDNGLYERDTFVDNVTVAPSERAIIDVLFELPGEYEIRNNNPESNQKIATVNVSASDSFTEAATAYSILDTRAAVTQEIDQLLADAKSSGVTKRLSTKVDMNPLFMQDMAEEMAKAEEAEEGVDHQGIEWEDAMPIANSRSNKENTSWSLVDLDNPREESFDWSFSQGDVVTVSIENSYRTMHPMQHPVHMHGQKFIVASIDGVPTQNRVFKDVVQVPVGSTYELVVRMENTGTWLMHCHISEHMESGMMGKFNVN